MKHIIGQHLMIGISGTSLTQEEKSFIVSNNICGVTLFGRNIQDPQQVRNLCEEIQKLRHQMRDKLPLLIGIDMEGGRVARFKAPFTEWPAAKLLGDLDSPTVSFHFAQAMGEELRAVGINLNYAPCLDVLTNPQNKVIGDRALSTDPRAVEKHSSAIIRGFLKSRVIPCVKHFPGHGNTLLDSHDALPIEESDLKRLNEIELIPFKRAIKSKVQMIMGSHLHFKNIDAEWPVTLSEIFLKKLLRDELRYKGLVITDDLGMKALTSHFDSRMVPVKAIQAGNDLLLFCNEPYAPPQAIESLHQGLVDGLLTATQLNSSYERIVQFKKDQIENPDPLSANEMMKIVGKEDHQKLSQGIRAGSVPASLLTGTDS